MLITPSPPSSLGKQTIGQAALGGFFLLRSDPLHKQCFLYLSICLTIVLGKRRLHMAKVGKAVRIAFVSSNLPASLKKEEKATNLLSHLVARGQKSATVGLVKLKGRPK
jgi:hypothetical protein